MIPLERKDAKRASTMCARAFFEEPFYKIVFPDKTTRFKKLINFFHFRIKYGLNYGKVYTTSNNIEDIAIWLSTEKPGMHFSRMLRCGVLFSVLTMGIQSVQQLMDIEKYLAIMHSKTITKFHWHLSPVAVDKSLQGQGKASQLMKPMFKKFDEEKISCFLETQTPENVEIYEHFGFKTMHIKEIPKLGMTNWSMLREPGN
jgi:ribosomal protein S18 acetylase RimI-like enzyme